MRDFGVADRGCSVRRRSSNASNSFFFTRERVDLAAHRVEQRAGFFLQLAMRSRLVFFAAWSRFELRGGFGRQLLGARERVVGARDLLHAFVQLAICDVHRPDHLVDAVGLHDGVLDRLLLALERLGFVRDVLGQRVERRQPLFGALAQLVELAPAVRACSRRP